MLVTEITIVTNRTWKGKEVGWGQLIQERESPLRASKDLAGGTEEDWAWSAESVRACVCVCVCVCVGEFTLMQPFCQPRPVIT